MAICKMDRANCINWFQRGVTVTSAAAGTYGAYTITVGSSIAGIPLIATVALTALSFFLAGKFVHSFWADKSVKKQTPGADSADARTGAVFADVAAFAKYLQSEAGQKLFTAFVTEPENADQISKAG